MIYRAPGVYVEEVSSGRYNVVAAGTSVAAFVGVAPNPGAYVNEAVPIEDWGQFLKHFVRDGDSGTPLANAVNGYLMNGGPRCYVVNTGGADEPLLGGGKGGRKGLEVLEPIDEIAIVAAPGRTDILSYDAVTNHCEKMQDRVGILDAPREFTVEQLTKVGTIPVPGVAETGEPPGLAPPRALHGHTAVYSPWFYGADAVSPKQIVLMPPSGHIAGIYARTDATRGVHKAPANERVKGAGRLAYNFTREEHALLNVNGINCIRFFPDQGITLFGARTTGDQAGEWKYVNVRRLFTMVETSIGRSTRGIVFEPNDYSTRQKVVRDITAFLTHLWKDGALLGRSAEEAFFVKCDDEVNPPEVVDAGMLVTVIGMAPVKPAEFVIFRIGQHQSGTVTSEGGANA